MAIKHSTVATKADEAGAEVNKAEWNADHTIENSTITNAHLAGSIAASKLIGTDIATVGTITTGVWQGTVIASAFLDADTAHLSETQTFSGAKTFSDTVTIDSAGGLVFNNQGAGGDPTFTCNDANRLLTLAGGLICQEPVGQHPLTGNSTSTTDTTQARTALKLKHTTTQEMADGFGTSFQSSVEDATSGELAYGSVKWQRDGADNQSKLVFENRNGGSFPDVLTFDRTGKMFILDSDESHQIGIVTPNESSDRDITIPPLGGNKTFALSDIANSWGAFDQNISTGGSWQEGGANISPIGTHTQWLAAGAWGKVTTNGAEFAELELGTNDIMLQTFNFDQTTSEKIQFWWEPPAEWDAGTITFNVKWTAASGSGTVTWKLEGRSYSDSDAIDQAIGGTAQSVTDTLLTANDMHISPESGNVTINGATKGEAVLLQLSRDIADTLSADAKLIGVNITFTTDEATKD